MTDHEASCHALVADCRLRAATDLFVHTWDPVVLVTLHEGPRRRRDLRVAIGGIRDKVLAESLRRLLDHGLIERRAHAESPPRVEYALTGLGLSLVEGPMRALAHWVTEYGDELLDAQERAALPAPPGSPTWPGSPASSGSPAVAAGAAPRRGGTG